ncbi:3-oxoadipate enol-lactone hydrolase [Novosphingobium barchaimii LL02]|uniref:3-oxoadipate enol-lactone hydrolase n=1 Tax=Novosphingobium barchaimii LL02 TaxID=1114963 RepID=A0A0J7Y9Q2_9SPHN|nr:alpha/beta fold hydrolase [Novosphingobium barchaimii]KMS60347.1 3-oxoadipate enol-lactone hydrolase [Novosphingobium barchaimii LL02]
MDFEPFTLELGSAALSGTARKGAGTPLVLVHGFGGSRQDWQPLIAALPANRPLIAYDQRGFGESQADAGTPFSHADDLLALLGALEIAQADLCGMSLGGATALNFALNRPERVRRLVLISPLMVGWSWTSEWIERWKTIGRAARSGDIALARDLWWCHPLFDTLREAPAGGAMQTSIEAYHGRQWVQDDQRPALPDIDRLANLSMPALLLAGERDTEDFRLIAKVIAAMGQQVTCIDHAGVGHMLNLEIPEVIAGEIESFLSA